MPSACMMSASDIPPPLPARGNLPPLRKVGSISRTASAMGRPLPAPPMDASTAKNNVQTLPGRNKKTPATNYENHEIRMARNKSSPSQLNNMTVETPPPPPNRPPKHRSVSISGLPNSLPPPPTGDSDIPPALPSRGPPRKPAACGSSSPRNMAASGDLEARFLFHDPRDFPPPDTFVGDCRSYASKKKNGQHRGSRRRKTSDLPSE